jgi:hypothetical protein
MVSGFPSIADGGLRKSILGPQLLNERVFGTHTKRLSPVGGIINCHRLAKSLGYTPTTTAPEGVCTPDPLLKNAARRCLPEPSLVGIAYAQLRHYRALPLQFRNSERKHRYVVPPNRPTAAPAL